MLQVRGIVNWGMGDTRNVTGGTERLVRDLNNITEHGANQANRAIARSTEGNLQTLNNLNEKAGQRLIKQKQHIADAGAKAISSVKPKPLPAGTGVRSETKKRQLEIDNVVAGAERAHARFKKLQKDTGIGSQVGGKTMAQDLGRFYAQDREDREGQIDLLRTAKKETKERIKTLDDEYEAMHKGSKAAHENRQELAEEIQALEYLDTSLKQVTSDHQKLTNVERIEANERKKNGEMAKRLHANQREMEKLNYQMAREKLQMQRQIGEEIDRTSEQVGTSLRNAFTYATVAITAFYYKLSQTTQVFMEFESELVNAQSIWQSSNEQLFAISDSVVQFGQKFGIEMGKATEGLYQYASAGVEASEAMEMLEHTLTLSMAVQGDHNTLAKLTTQTIMGFNMEFSEAGEVTDKFAHAINKSLIEWDDLASSIKFALPFFISTGQSLDQLLGALSVLTNRALEAGIAGRGLRQALAEFTQHAEDNSAAFRKLGVEILDLEGNMYPLDQIAKQFNETMGESATDMEIMIALMEDLNIRGATAFIHLVQNADEFTAQVNDLQNSAGAAVEMAEIQQQSLAMQIQLVKNALQAPFLLADEVGQAHGYLNEFSMIMHQIVSMFEDLIVTGEEGNKKLTEMGQFLKDFVIVAMKEFAVIIEYTLQLMKSWSDEHGSAYAALSLLTIPLQTLLRLMSELGPFWLNTILMYKILNTLLPVNIVLTMQQMKAELMHIAVLEQDLALSEAKALLTTKEIAYREVTKNGIWEINALTAAGTEVKEAEAVVDGIKNANAEIDLMMTM